MPLTPVRPFTSGRARLRLRAPGAHLVSAAPPRGHDEPLRITGQSGFRAGAGALPGTSFAVLSPAWNASTIGTALVQPLCSLFRSSADTLAPRRSAQASVVSAVALRPQWSARGPGRDSVGRVRGRWRHRRDVPDCRGFNHSPELPDERDTRSGRTSHWWSGPAGTRPPASMMRRAHSGLVAGDRQRNYLSGGSP